MIPPSLAPAVLTIFLKLSRVYLSNNAVYLSNNGSHYPVSIQPARASFHQIPARPRSRQRAKGKLASGNQANAVEVSDALSAARGSFATSVAQRLRVTEVNILPSPDDPKKLERKVVCEVNVTPGIS